MKTLKTLFTEHPHEVGMSYIGHFFYALSVTSRLFSCVPICFIHAFFPFLFTHTTSTIVQKLNDEFINHKTANDHMETDLFR